MNILYLDNRVALHQERGWTMHMKQAKAMEATLIRHALEVEWATLFWMMWLLAALLLIMRPLPTQAQSRDIADEDITTAIVRELAVDDAVSAHLIDVSTEDGVVTISGSVGNLLARDRAAQIVKITKGVRAIVNRLQVRPVSRPDEEVKADIERALLLDPATDSYEIAVSVEGGRATLTGRVDSWAEKKLAEQVAKGIKGVAQIRNNVDVTYEMDRRDSEIKAEIERLLASDPYLYADAIEVEVNDGRVLYTGTVMSLLEKSHASHLGWVTGVKGVDTAGLKIEWWRRDGMQRPPRLEFRSSEEIATAVKTALAHDPRVSSFTVGVTASGGVVTLAGTVDNLKAKRAAERDARDTVGVLQMENHIKVRPVNPPSDEYIRQQIQRALTRDSVIEPYDLTALVRNQKVHLYGEAPSYYVRNRADDVTARIFGVAAVANHIEVATSPTVKSDAQIKEAIEDQFFWSVFVDGGDIIVDVDDGVATLRGAVDSWRELRAAVEDVFQAGAKGVENKLQIRDTSQQLYPERYYPSLFWAL